MPRILVIVLAAVIAAACSVAAQEAGPPPDVRFDRVRTGTDSMQIYLVRGRQPTHVGMLWDSLQVVEHAGVPAVRREYWTKNRAFGPEHAVYLYRLPHLSPLSIVDEGTSPEALRFTADSVVGWGTTPEGRMNVARVLGPGVYDGTVFDLLVRAGDLRDGYRVSIPAYLSEMDSVVTLTARVTGSEPVEVEGGRMADAWVVQMDFAGLASTLWIDKQTRALSRQTIEIAPGVSMLMDRRPVRDPSQRDSR